MLVDALTQLAHKVNLSGQVGGRRSQGEKRNWGSCSTESSGSNDGSFFSTRSPGGSSCTSSSGILEGWAPCGELCSRLGESQLRLGGQSIGWGCLGCMVVEPWFFLVWNRGLLCSGGVLWSESWLVSLGKLGEDCSNKSLKVGLNLHKNFQLFWWWAARIGQSCGWNLCRGSLLVLCSRR